MAVAIDKNLVVAGFINTSEDKLEFTLEDVIGYILIRLWNAGAGPVRWNFTEYQLARYLDNCDGVCLRCVGTNKYIVDKSLLNPNFNSPREAELMNNAPELAKAFDLFCRLQVDTRTDRYLLDAMGYRWIYA